MWSNVVLDTKDGEAFAGPIGRSKHAVAFDGQALYLYGGKYSTYPLKDLWKMDLRAGEWTNLKNQNENTEWPPALQEHTMVHHDGKLYIFGGEIGMTDECATPLWIYSLKLQEWRKWNSAEINNRNRIGGKGLTPVGRRGHAACVYNSYMFIYGGYRDLKGSLGDLWAYHFETDSWHLFYKPLPSRFSWSSSPSPVPRHNHSMVEHNDFLYIYGGMQNLEEKSDCWKYGLAERKWMLVKTKHGPGPLRGHVACTALGNMILVGGDREGRLVDEVWRFCFGTETFHRLVFHGCHPAPRVFPACVMLPAIVKTVPKMVTTKSLELNGKRRSNSSKKGGSSSPTSSMDNDSKYWWDDELINICTAASALGSRGNVCSNTNGVLGQSQNPLKNINIIRDFSNRLNNHRLGNYQALESAIVDECGVNNSISPMTLSSPSSPEETLEKIDEEKLIEIEEVQIKQLQGILTTARRSESVTCFQPGNKAPVRKSASTVRFADYNMPNSTSDYMSMETLFEDQRSRNGVFTQGSEDSTVDGFENPNYVRKTNNGQDIEMTCFKQHHSNGKEEATSEKETSAHSRQSTETVEEVQVVATPNYLLLLGGLDSHSNHLVKKPLSIWRLRVSAELFNQTYV